MADTAPLALLFSYHYFKTAGAALCEELDRFPTRPLTFCDSGAFSAMSQGADVDPDAFARWYLDHAEYFDFVCTLDVGGAAGTYLHTLRLEEMGLPVMPVFHINDDPAALDYWLDNYSMIGYGGMVPFSARQRPVARWLTANLDRAQRAGVAVHALGNTNWRTLAGLPFYSADSSWWTAGRRYGNINLWDDSTNRMVSMRMRGDRRLLFKNGDLLRRWDLDPVTLSDPAYISTRGKGTEEEKQQYWKERFELDRANLLSQLGMAGWWRGRFDVAGPADKPSGPHLFMVAINVEEVREIRAIVTTGEVPDYPSDRRAAAARHKERKSRATAAPA